MFVATLDKVQDNRQYINIHQTPKAFKNHTLKYPDYTVSIPQENTQEFLKTIEKLDTFSPRVNQTYKENPERIKKISFLTGGMIAGASGFVAASLFSAKGLIKTIVTGLAFVAGGLIGNKSFYKSAAIFAKMDELGMRVEPSKTKAAKQEPAKTEAEQELAKEAKVEETETEETK